MKFLFVPIWGYNVNNDYKEQVKQFKVEERKLSKKFSEEHCFSPNTIVTTVEIETLEELLKLVRSVKGEVVLATPDYFNSFSYSSQRDILSEYNLDGYIEIYDDYRE